MFTYLFDNVLYISKLIYLLIGCETFNSLPVLERSSLFYKTIIRHERDECDTSDTNTTRVLHKRHECDTSEKF